MEFEDSAPFIFIGFILVAIAGGVLWYEDRYPCVKYEAVWVKEWTEIQVHQHSCGDGCNFTTVIPITHPAHWEQSCSIRGDKRNGDKRAAFAPIPLQPLEK